MININNYLQNKSQFLMISGPCSLESKEQADTLFSNIDSLDFLRAGLFKMRTSPNSFQGMGQSGIELIKELKKEKDFQFVTEITDPRQVEMLEPVVDMYQVGSRNMYNYELLRELNTLGKPVLFKRAFSATVKEWLNACGYMPDLGEEKILLCERGIRTFETSSRNTLDINSVIYLKQNYNFKVIVDPSHATGIAKMVRPLCHVALASGADGLLIETHPTPNEALSDVDQQITPQEYNDIRAELIKMSSMFGREII